MKDYAILKEANQAFATEMVRFAAELRESYGDNWMKESEKSPMVQAVLGLHVELDRAVKKLERVRPCFRTLMTGALGYRVALVPIAKAILFDSSYYEKEAEQ